MKSDTDRAARKLSTQGGVLLRFSIPVEIIVEVDSQESLDRALAHDDLEISFGWGCEHVTYASDGHKAFRKVVDKVVGEPQLISRLIPSRWEPAT